MANHDQARKKKREWIEAACLVSFLYDVSGRSEDAFHLTWDKIEQRGAQGVAELEPGKTSTKRTNPLTSRTMDLLKELGSEENKTGKVFKFTSPHYLRVYLKRKISTIKLPAEN